MSKEIRAKKRCPTVIARLFGKECISLQGHANKQPKTQFPSYQFDVQQKSRQYDDFSNSRSSSNQELFKDVYEDLGTSNSNRRSSTKWSVNSMLTKHELELIQQSVEASSARGSRHIAVLKPSDSIKYKSNSKAGDLTDTCITSHPPHTDGLLLEPPKSRNAHILRDSLRIKPEEKSKENTHPRKIVILKPNIQNKRNDIGLKRTKEDPKEIEARQSARSITRRLKNRYASKDANCSELKGYEGDVSDSDALRFSSRKSFGDSKLCRYPPSSSWTESSSVNKEAKPRICERWRITQKYQDLELSADYITLGEMLAADGERRSICISSSHGWKDEKSVASSRSSRSLPPSKDRRSHRIYKSNDDKFDKYLMYNDDVFSNRDTKSMIRKHPHCHNLFINEMESHLEASFESQMVANVKDTSEQHLMLQMGANDDTCKLTAHEGIVIMVATDDKASQNQQDFDRQELQKGNKQESSASSKDADRDRASPVSVLPELPYPGDNASSSSLSSYQCFEKVSAELNELRMQLESLTIQSGDIESMDDEFNDFSRIPYVGNDALRTENWETNCALDVLICSGLENCGFDMLKTNWHSPAFPLDPTLFDDLENKYNDEATGLWSERKFLFDRINFALVEIFQEQVHLFPWVTRKITGALNCLKQKDWIRAALQDKMNRNYAEWATSERELDQETQWSDCNGEIEVIGIEIEGLLISDMIAEVFFKVSQDIVNAMEMVSSTKQIILKLRETGWNVLLQKVNEFCEKQGIEVPDMSSQCKSSRGQARKGNITWEHHYRIDIFYGTIDCILQEMKSRFSEDAVELLKLTLALDPKDDYKSFNINDICKLVEKFYPVDFTHEEQLRLKYQLELFELDIRNNVQFKGVQSLSGVCQLLSKLEKSTIYPLVDRLIRLILTLPVSTATSERAFSAMKIVKTRLRSKMGDEFLSSALLMNIEKEITRSFDVDSLIDDFEVMKKRRVQFTVRK